MLTFRCSSKVRTLFNEARRPNIIDQCRFYKANTRKQKTEASSTYCDIKLARRATNNRLTKRIYSAPLPQTLDFFLKLSRVEEGEGTVKPKTRSDEVGYIYIKHTFSLISTSGALACASFVTNFSEICSRLTL